jgi:hypothetical protein
MLGRRPGRFDCVHLSAVDKVVNVLLRYMTHIDQSATFNTNLAGRNTR